MRIRLLLVALAGVSAACSPSASPGPTSTVAQTTTTTSSTTTTTVAPTTSTTSVPRPAGVLPAFDDDGDGIDIDFAVRIGTLDNGMMYYIRRNNRPGARAQLRLAVKAGSVQEEDDQHGGAHFLEHMLFNGTEKYPANDLIQVLQSFGSEFGPDINAYTSYEETVYELNLPTDVAGPLEAGLDVLFQWASAATVDPDEVDLERGVLVEEWRLRSQGFGGRYFEGVVDALLGGTAYEGQNTLADPDTIASTTHQSLRRFYDDWYRPDNMAIVAVGDFDVAAVETLITEIFGAMPGRGGPPVPAPATEPATEPEFFILADPEYQQSFVELNYALPALPAGTVGSERQQMALDLAWGMLTTRLQEDALRGQTVFFDASFAANPIVRTQRSPGLAAFADPDELLETTEGLLGEIERALIHGFTQDELDRVTVERRSSVDAEFDRSATTQDATYADRYVGHFLGGAPIPAARVWRDLNRRLLDEMTVDQVTETFRAVVQSTEPFVIIVGPEGSAGDLPTESDLAAVVDRVRTANYERRVDSVESIEVLMDPPELAEIIAVYTLDPTAIEILLLENGARVVIFPTQIVDDVVVFGATSFGGWSLVSESDATEAQLIPSIVASSGVGDVDEVTLQRFLTGRVVTVAPFISETAEGLFGRAAIDELETAFQLINRYMSQPRVDDVGLQIVLDGTRPFAEDPNSSPQLAVGLEVADARFGGDPRFAPVPTVEDLDTFDLERALEIYQERFSDASNFVFVFSGDVDLFATADLARRYLGTLPSTDSRETFVDVRTDRDVGIERRTVKAGSGELGELTLLWDTAAELDGVTRIEARLLELVLRQRLTERIREELSATYSPSTRIAVIDEPARGIEVTISMSADPEDLDAVASEVVADLTDLRDNGPTQEQLLIAQEQLIRELELFSNERFIEIITFYMLRSAEDAGDLFEEFNRAMDATRSDLRQLARLILPLDDYIEVKLVPEAFDA